MRILIRGGGNIQLSEIYANYFLRVTYLVSITVGVEEPGDIGTLEVAMRDINVLPQYVSRTTGCYLLPNGDLSFVLPAECEQTEPLGLQLRSPDGTEIWSLSSSRQSLAASNFWNWVANPLIYSPLSFNAAAQGEMLRFRGKVVDLQGCRQVSHRQVIIWGQRDQQNILQPVGLSETDANGNFFCEYPAGYFHAAKATISGTSSADLANPLPIELINPPHDLLFVFPAFVFLVVTEVSESTEDCDCQGAKVPRCPDASDLHDNADTYSQDIGGACVNMTMPNRSLEEFSYYMVVRTTEPQIKGLTLNNYEIHRRQAPAEGGIEVIVEGNQPPPLLLRANPYEHYGEEAMLYSDRVVMDGNNGADWDNTPTIYQAVTISHGHILQYKQTWKADGYSLGDLLFSLPLAPGQKKQIAIFDWDRKEAAVRQEEQHYDESLEAYLSHDRDVHEITNTALQESMRGGSRTRVSGFGGGLGVGVAVPLEVAILGVAGGFAGGVGTASSTAWQNSGRNISANSLQNLQENIMQSASAVRSQRSTVVQTVSESESFRVETDSVANYNHCHALTMEYFEVLRHFCVEQKLASVQECLFVPLQMGLFDEHKALRWKEILKQALSRRFGFNVRKNSLLAAFDSLERYVNERAAVANNLSQYPPDMDGDGRATYSEQTILEISGEMTLSFRLNRPQDFDAGGPLIPPTTNISPTGPWAVYCLLLGISPSQIRSDYFDNDTKTATERNKIFERELAPKIVKRFIEKLMIQTADATGTLSTLVAPDITISGHAGGQVSPVTIPGVTKLDLTQVSPYRRETKLKITIRSTNQAIGLRRNQIDKLLLKTTYNLASADEFSAVTVNSLTLRYRTAYGSGFICKEVFIQNDLAAGDDITLFCPLNAEEMRNPKMEDWLASNKLLQHLNANLESYHQTIWYNMSSERRYMILDGYIAPHSGGKSVASVVENRLLGIVGNNLIMPVSPGYKLDPTYTVDPQNPATLLDHYKPLTPVPPYRVSVPTRGVFAEAIQGACNSCEKIDNTRFWKWEEHPIPDNPTAINPINTPTPVVTEPNLTPSQLPTSMINIQNAPNVPDPQGYNSLLQVLGTKGLFDNITGLDQNQKNALEAMLSSQNAAQNYASMAGQLAQVAGQYKLLEDMKQNAGNDISKTPAERKAQIAEIEQAQLEAVKNMGKNNVVANNDFGKNFETGQDIADRFGHYGKSFKVKQQNADGSSLEVESEGKNDDIPLEIEEEQPTNIVILFDTNKANPALNGLPASFRFMRTRHPIVGSRSIVILLGNGNNNNIFATLTTNPAGGGAFLPPNTAINGILLKEENGATFGNTTNEQDNNLDFQFGMSSSSNNTPALSNLIMNEFTNANNLYIDYGNNGQINFIAKIARIYSIVSGLESLRFNGLPQAIQGESYGQIMVNPLTLANPFLPPLQTINVIAPLIFDERTFVGTLATGILTFQQVLTVLNSANPPGLDALQGFQNVPNGLWIPQLNPGAWGYFRTAVTLPNIFTPAEQAVIVANCNINGHSVIVDAQNITFYANNGFAVLLNISRNKTTIKAFDFAKNLFNPFWEGLVNDN